MVIITIITSNGNIKVNNDQTATMTMKPTTIMMVAMKEHAKPLV